MEWHQRRRLPFAAYRRVRKTRLESATSLASVPRPIRLVPSCIVPVGVKSTFASSAPSTRPLSSVPAHTNDYVPFPAPLGNHDDPAPKKRLRASAVCSGASAGKKCPKSRARPLTSSPQTCQSAIGPPSSTYQVPSRPEVLHKTRSEQAIRHPLARSALSCSRSMVAAARYSSQMA